MPDDLREQIPVLKEVLSAMGLAADYGSITPGKVASFFLTKPLTSAAYMLYSYTEPVIETVYLKGIEYRV